MKNKDNLIIGVLIFLWLIIGINYLLPDLNSNTRDYKAALEENRLKAIEQNTDTSEINALVDINNIQDEEKNKEDKKDTNINYTIENTNTDSTTSQENTITHTENYTPDSSNNYIPTQTNTIEETVWIGATGTKYHRNNCRTLKSNIYEISLQDALNQGRQACKVCNP